MFSNRLSCSNPHSLTLFRHPARCHRLAKFLTPHLTRLGKLKRTFRVSCAHKVLNEPAFAGHRGTCARVPCSLRCPRFHLRDGWRRRGAGTGVPKDIALRDAFAANATTGRSRRVPDEALSRGTARILEHFTGPGHLPRPCLWRIYLEGPGTGAVAPAARKGGLRTPFSAGRGTGYRAAELATEFCRLGVFPLLPDRRICNTPGSCAMTACSRNAASQSSMGAAAK